MSTDPIGSADFGAALRHYRTGAGLSLSALAKSTNYSKSHLSRIEHGLKQPSLALARTCDRELETGGELAKYLAPAAAEEPDISGPHGDIWTLSMTSDGLTEFSALDRISSGPNGAQQWMGWTIGPPQDWANAAEHVVPAFHGWFVDLRTLGQRAPSGLVSQMLIGATNVVRGVLTTTEVADRPAMLGLASRFAEYTGWMAQENGSDSAALWWTAYAVRLAESAGDRETVAYALVRRADIALYQGDPIRTIELSRQAQASECHARIRSLAAQREAQGHAYAGDEEACRAALARAADLAAEMRGADDGPPFGSTTIPDPLAFAAAWCLNDLGYAAEAASMLDEQLDSVGPTAHRTRARFGARLAVSLAAAGEVDQACAAVRPVLELAPIIDSATVRHDLRNFSRSIGRWRSRPLVRTTLTELAYALRVHSPEAIRYSP